MVAQSSPALVSVALPSSWKTPSVGVAETAAGVASVTDWSANENKNNAVHSRVRLLRVRAFIENQSPRDIG